MAAMLTLIDLLTPDEAREIREALAETPFRDGKLTAGPSARRVKSNLQADGTDERVQALAHQVRDAFARHDVFRLYARPARWSRLLFSRYASGDRYGLHVDDATMAAEEGGRLRTDLSFTLFLSEPQSYEGGALLVDGVDGEREVKLPAGGVVLYPTGALHQVQPVTAGERLACVGWIQSLVRREDERELLFDLGRVRATLPEGEARLLLDKSIGNLLRLWIAP
jgi:PKHD-type hydroxylase